MDIDWDVLTTIEHQADQSDVLGSPLYGVQLRGIAADYRAGGLSATLLDGAGLRPLHDALVLRYVGAGHRLALAGDAPDLARWYPSCGGSWNGEDPTPDFLALVTARTDYFRDALQRQVQTNEVARAVVLTCGLAHLADGRPIRTLEIGASAGLLSRLPWFCVDTGTHVCGPTDSPVYFGPESFVHPPPSLPASIVVAGQAASDLTPIDVSTPAGQVYALSFLWPDQVARVDRMRAALEVAARHQLPVDAGDAGEWLTGQLAAPLPDGVVTVVFHSIVWQYLPHDTKDAIRAALREAGSRATSTSPLAWLRMEPATREFADVRANVWPSTDPMGTETVLAEVGYHGANVRWLAD